MSGWIKVLIAPLYVVLFMSAAMLTNNLASANIFHREEIITSLRVLFFVCVLLYVFLSRFS